MSSYFSERGEFRLLTPLNITLSTKELQEFTRQPQDRNISYSPSSTGAVLPSSINTLPRYEWELPIITKRDLFPLFMAQWISQEDKRQRNEPHSFQFLDLTEPIQDTAANMRPVYDSSRTVETLPGVFSYYPIFNAIIGYPPEFTPRGMVNRIFLRIYEIL